MSFSSAKPKILVVDDDDGILRSLKILLESEGYDVEPTKRGIEAIEKSKKNPYDLALLDYNLPDIKGTKLLEEIRMDTPKMKIIMITGYITQERKLEALGLGADDFLEKPVSPQKLLDTVRKRLRERQIES